MRTRSAVLHSTALELRTECFFLYVGFERHCWVQALEFAAIATQKLIDGFIDFHTLEHAAVVTLVLNACSYPNMMERLLPFCGSARTSDHNKVRFSSCCQRPHLLWYVYHHHEVCLRLLVAGDSNAIHS